VKHYNTDRDLVVGAGVQAPWPGALYNKPAIIHTHASHGALRRSYLPEKTLDGFSGHYCGCDGLGSTDSFGMPLQGFMSEDGKVNWKAVGIAAALAGAAFVAFKRMR
jgi:hypothetical protein